MKLNPHLLIVKEVYYYNVLAEKRSGYTRREAVTREEKQLQEKRSGYKRYAP